MPKGTSIKLSSDDVATLQSKYLSKFKSAKGSARSTVIDEAVEEIVPEDTSEKHKMIYEMVKLNFGIIADKSLNKEKYALSAYQGLPSQSWRPYKRQRLS